MRLILPTAPTTNGTRVPTTPDTPVLQPTMCNTTPDIRAMTQAVVDHYQDREGRLGYALFTAVHAHFFADELPWPLIIWGLTAHGHCVAFTRSSETTPPMILLHPSLLGGTEKKDPWGRPPAWLGVLYALDVLIHECMHVAVRYARGPWQGGTSSHNNPLWIAEVNRLAPLLGFPGEVAAMSKPRRIKGEGRLVRDCKDATMPFDVASRFPHALRELRGTAEAYYTAKRLPIPVELPDPWKARYALPHTQTLHTTECNSEETP
jgi:hypothetical protein